MKLGLFLLLPAAALAQFSLDCGVLKDAAIDPVTSQYYGVQNAAQGDVLLVRLLSTATDPAFNLKAALIDPVGRSVSPRSTAADALSKGTTTTYIFDLTFTGPHQIRIQNVSPASGSYRLSYTWLNKPCSAAGALTCGSAAKNDIQQPLQLDTYQFTAKANDVVSVRLLKLGTTARAFLPTLAAYSPAGQRLTPLTGTSTTIDTGGINGFGRMDLVAPADGPITFAVFDPNNGAGTYAVVAATLNRSCGTASLPCGTAVQGQIGSALSMNSFSLEKARGDVISIRTAVANGSASLLPVVEVYDSQGNPVQVARATLPVASRTVYTWSFTAGLDTPYVVIVRDNALVNTGGYSLTRVALNRPCEGAATLACGSVLDDSMSGLLATRSYALAANPNDVFLLRLLNTTQNGAFRPRLDIYDAAGNNIQTLTTSATDLVRSTFTIPVRGPYTVLVTDAFDNSQAGTYTVALLRLNAPCITAGTLTCGALTNGNFTRALDAPLYTYTAGAGQSFTVRMIDNTGGLQEGLEVYDPQGNLVGQNSSNPFAGVDVTKAAGGAYTILALDLNRRQTGGPFGMYLLATTNGCSAPAAQGTTVSGVVSATRPFVSYNLQVNAGDSLLVRSTSFTAGFSAQMDLYDPSGSRLDTANFGISRKAPASGAYTVVIGGNAPRTGGSYALSWQSLNSPTGTVPLACGGSAAGLLGAANEFRYYTANAAAGDIMRLVFTRLSDNFSPQLDLYDPSGARVPTSTADITQKAAADGDYLVLVGPSGATGESGTYSLAYQRANRPCNATKLTCGQTSLRSVTVPGQLDTWTFSGTAGDQASVRLTPRSGAYAPFGELYDSAGTRLVASGSTGLLRAVLPSGGPFTVLVRDLNGVNTGSYRASLQDDTHACTVSDSEPPSIALLQPTGGEVIAGGVSYRIQWQSDDNVAVSSHAVTLSTDGGKTFDTALATGLSGNQQSFDWTVPPDVAPTRNAVVRVTATDAAGNSQAAVSGPVSIIGSGFKANSTITVNYDGLNRITQAVTADGRSIQYFWDAAGNLVQITVAPQ